jgi:hypothetical protein
MLSYEELVVEMTATLREEVTCLWKYTSWSEVTALKFMSDAFEAELDGRYMDMDSVPVLLTGIAVARRLMGKPPYRF